LLESIYRFLSFPSFVDTIQRKSLTFVTYDMWDDPYEGFVLGATKTDEGREKIVACLNQMKHEIPPELVMNLLSGMRYTVHLQSWSRLNESDALWRIYGFSGSGIRIQTDRAKVNAIGGVTIIDVDYKMLSLVDEIGRICNGPNKIDISKAFSSKRKAFEHEQEVRLVTDIDGHYLPPPPRRRSTDTTFNASRAAMRHAHYAGQITKDQMNEGLKNIDLNEARQNDSSNQVKAVSFADVSNFIESVVVHPMAAPWFVSMVGEFCERNNVPFDGKSSLYTFKH
jgi:hypothetical protein